MSEMGFLGLGSMGLAMARNLAQDATILRVWNRTASKAMRSREKPFDGPDVPRKPRNPGWSSR